MDTSTEPNCPSCRAAWNRDFLNRELTGAFRNGPLRLHREKVLMDRERARFQETQEEAEAYKWARNMVPVLTEQANELYKIVPKIDHTHPDWIEWQRVNERVRHLLWAVGRETAGPAPKKERKVFTHKCPGAGCEGFLSTQWKCGLCDGSFCKDCHEPKTTVAGHTCNPDTVESVKAIKKEAKPCPKCASQISKIDGCDQMWCTQCHTAFSWRTGEIETHIVHNPHYFQWMREQGNGAIPRAPGDRQPPVCGGVPALVMRIAASPAAPADNTVLPAARFQDETVQVRLTHYIQLLQHILHDEIPVWRHRTDDASWDEMRRRFRVQRMVGCLNRQTHLRLKMQKKLDDPVNMDDTWKHELMLLENRILRARDRVQLMDMYATAGMDILGQFMEGESVTEDKVKSIYTQFGALYKYVEKSNKEFSRAYSTKEIKIQP